MTSRSAGPTLVASLCLRLCLRPCLFLCLCLAAACGGGDTAAAGGTTPAAGSTAQPAGSKAGERGHPGLTPELDAFHETLAPLWHAEPGPARIKNTCARAADFRVRAASVMTARAPAGASARDWQEAGAVLLDAVFGLEAACGGTAQAGFDTAFAAVHDAFHRAMALSAGEPGHTSHD